MKEPYLPPTTDVFTLMTSGSILSASNETMEIEEVEVFSAPVMDPSLDLGESLLDELLIL